MSTAQRKTTSSGVTLPNDIIIESIEGVKGKNLLYQFNRPSPAQKEAVIALMGEYKMAIDDYYRMQDEMLFEKHPDAVQGSLAHLSEQSQEFMKKMRAADFAGVLPAKVFAIWAQRGGTGYDDKTATEIEALEKWFHNNGAEVTLANFLSATS